MSDEARPMPREELERRYSALQSRNTKRRAALKQLQRAYLVKLRMYEHLLQRNQELAGELAKAKALLTISVRPRTIADILFGV